MIAILAVHAAVAAVAARTGRRLGRNVFLLAAAAPAVALVWSLVHAAGVIDGVPRTQRWKWAPELGLGLESRLDGFALLMTLLVSGVGVLVLVYSRWYFSPGPGLGRFAGVMTAFAGSMLGVVLSDNLLAVYVFWELTSVTSFLIIGYEDNKNEARNAAIQAFLVTGAGGLAMLAGFILLGQAAGTYSLSGILADPPTGATVGPALLLILAGVFTKSAQVPFHFWLPSAMAAPTPASAYLHAAAMVKAGVYLVARMAPAFADAHAFWRPLVVSVGIVTLLLGGWRALGQHDLKLLLAYGTISQLGFMVALVGAGRPELTFAGAALLLAHGLFKAALFLVVGIVDHGAGTRDLRRLSGLATHMPLTAAVAAVAVASMAGIPPLFGFVAKEAAFEALVHEGRSWGIALAGIVAGAVLTTAYGVRFVWGAFATKPGRRAAEKAHEVHAPPAPFVAPAVLLAAVTLVVGLFPRLAGPLVASASSALDPSHSPGKLALWHGLNLPLLLSGVALATGAALFRWWPGVEGVMSRLPAAPDAEDAYRGLVKTLNRVADRTTGVVQNGSLPVYIGVILTTVLLLPGSALLLGPPIRWPDDLATSPMQGAVAAVVAVGAIAAAAAQRRFSAVLLLGGVGFGVAVLFVIHGAPDLALTQLLVETLLLVIFVLVLRHLPSHFTPAPWPLRRVARVLIAGGVGVFVAAFALVASGHRIAEPISDAYVERALPEAGGRNIVNVILVDFRAMDTLGEITVLAVAAMGIASLLAAGRRAVR